MPDQLIRELSTKLESHLARDAKMDEQHQFLRDHAKNEERALETIDKTLGELLMETRAQTQNSMRAADIQAARLAMDQAREQRRADAAEAERARQAELEKLELEQRGKVGAFLTQQWDKYGLIVIGVLTITFAPQLAPVLLQYLGIAQPQQVQVVAPQPDPIVVPVPVHTAPAEESEP